MTPTDYKQALNKAAQGISDREVAARISPFLDEAEVWRWKQGIDLPPKWTWDYVLRQIRAGVPGSHKVDCTKVDFGRRTKDLVRDLGVTKNAVAAARRKHAPHTVDPVKQTAVDWTRVDWSLPTMTLAKKLKRDPGVVSVNRRKHAPETLANTNRKQSPSG